MKDHKIMMWRVLSLVVAFFAALSLTFAPVLAPDFTLAPAFADNDDDDDDDDNNKRNERASLTKADARAIFAACQEAALGIEALFRGVGGFPIFWCAVVDREGHLLLVKATDTGEKPGKKLKTDAARMSIEIAIAKAYTTMFSNNQVAVTSRAIGELAQPGGPLFGIGNSNPYRPLIGSRSLSPDDRASRSHHGIITFPGGVPVYSNVTGATDGTCESGGGVLVGGVGVSGDGVDQDEAGAIGAIQLAGFCTEP